MSKQDHLLIVDDDVDIRNLLRTYLERHGYRVSTAADGREMRSVMERSRPDLIILDLMLPGEDGLLICRNLRATSNVPIIMLTALSEETDRILGLEMGADDYLPKPFSPRELMARVKSVLRRARSLPDVRHQEANVYCFAGWTLDNTTRNLRSPAGVVVALSGTEYRLLRIFLEHPKRVLTRDALIDLMLSRDAAPFDRAIDVQVSRLRHRLEDDAKEPSIIKTVRGQGYVLAVQVSTPAS
jgi:two-component system, OmpR family, response regulator